MVFIGEITDPDDQVALSAECYLEFPLHRCDIYTV
jgi:hypothetical protein